MNELLRWFLVVEELLANQTRGYLSPPKMVVTKEEATLNFPNERILALDASHRDLVRYPSQQNPSYRMVLRVLKDIASRPSGPPPTPPSLSLDDSIKNRRGKKKKPVSGEPGSPVPESGEESARDSRSMNFTGYVHAFSQGTLDSEKSCSVSDLHEKSPRELLNIPKAGGTRAEDETQTEVNMQAPVDAKPSPIFWAHIPFNITSWVNVC